MNTCKTSSVIADYLEEICCDNTRAIQRVTFNHETKEVFNSNGEWIASGKIVNGILEINQSDFSSRQFKWK